MTPSSFGTARLAAAAAMMLLALAGCDRVKDTLGVYDEVSQVAPRPVGPERLRVVLPQRGARATLAPVARRENVTVWQTLDGITLTFEDGVLTQTRGLGDDLMSADVSHRLAMLRGDTPDGYYPHIRAYLDGENQTVFRSFQCRRTGSARRPSGAEAGARVLRRIEETCISPRRRFTNIYWLDSSGTVVKSRQWVSPVIEFLETARVAR